MNPTWIQVIIAASSLITTALSGYLVLYTRAFRAELTLKIMEMVEEKFVRKEHCEAKHDALDSLMQYLRPKRETGRA